jgi:hypothetical protein
MTTKGNYCSTKPFATQSTYSDTSMDLSSVSRQQDVMEGFITAKRLSAGTSLRWRKEI